MADRPVTVVRVYEDPGRAAGEHRVLVDRLWPRGLNKAAVDHDEWAKEVAPSAELRKWYGHLPERFEEFARRYREELDAPPAVDEVARLSDVARRHRLVLLTATRDVPRSGAEVLRSVLEHHSREAAYDAPPRDGGPGRSWARHRRPLFFLAFLRKLS